MFQYVELAVNTLFSPQVMLFGLVVYVLVSRKDILERIKSMKLFGAEIDLAHIEKTIDKAVIKIDNLEEKLDGLSEGYIDKLAQDFDPIASTKDLDKLGTELKAMAASLDDIDFVEKYLHQGSGAGEVYAAGCAIQVRPQPKFLSTLLAYISEVSKTPRLDNVRLRIWFKLLQCVEKIITTDSRRENKVIGSIEIEKAIQIIECLAQHPICNADRPTDGTDGIPSKVEKLKKKFHAEVRKREV